MNDCDEIVVAGDQGEILDAGERDESDDGTIACERDEDGSLTIHVDTTTDLGRELAWHARCRGEPVTALVRRAIERRLQ